MSLRWWRTTRLAGVIAGVGLLGMVGMPGVGVAGRPTVAAACGDGGGVSVVVDFGALGGGVQTGCADGDPASGLAALSGARFDYGYVRNQPGLICQINAQPNPCNGAPTTAYWSYWHAGRGGSWSFSNLGAGSYDPAPGSVEGWAFGAGQQPAAAPPTPQPAPAPGQPPRLGIGQPGARAGQPSPSTGPPPSTAASTSGTAESSAGPSNAIPSETPTVSTTDPSSPTGSPPASPAAGAGSPQSGGGVLGLVVGATVIAALAGLGWWTARRRRQADP